MKKLVGAVAFGVAVTPLLAGTAMAAEEIPSTDAAAQELGGQETPEAGEDVQSPLQGLVAGAATGEQLVAQFMDGADGNGPTGADGAETEFPAPDYRFVEGPAGGLLDGPFD